MRRTAVLFVFLAGLSGALLPATSAVGQRTTDLVRIPFPQDDGTLTPYTFELGYPLVTLVYDTLMWRDARGIPRPWLARSVRRSPDGRRVTVDLRDGVRWHDGEAVTAADVVFTFNFVRRNPHLRFTPQLSEVEQVRAAGPLTVQIDLRRPVLGFFDQPLSDVPILPRHLWAGLLAGRRAPDGLPVGSGPYRMASYGPGRGYILAANRSYFLGLPRVDRIEVEVIRSAAGTFDALDRGNVDMVPAGLTQETAKRFGAGLGIDIRKGVSYSGTALSFNLRTAPFDDPAVRRAVARALDLGRISEAVGQVVPAAGGFLHPRSPWAPGSELHRSDEAAARRAFEEAGSPPIEVLAQENNLVRVEAGREVVNALRRIGADATLSEVSRRTLDRALGADGTRPAFQAAMTPIPALVSYDPTYLQTSFGSRARLNQTGYRSREFDRLADEVAAAPTRATRLRAVAAQLQTLARDVPAVPLLFSEGAFAYRPSVYDGWVFVRGAGILDKRSFLTGQGGAAARQPKVEVASGSDDDVSLGPFGIAAVALLFVAIMLASATFWRRRTR